MYHFWASVIEPLFDILQPREIVEIGADFGHNTRNILEYCRRTDARAHIVDPVPKFEPDAFKDEYGNVFEFYQSLSLNALPLIKHMDAVLIDGDHNWFTVYHELKLIEKNCRLSESAFPLIIIHDVEWPYARRDLYYHPDNIPEAFRMPYAKKGLMPGNREMVDTGGLNPHLYNAIYENNFRCGVLTAVEDFIGESGTELKLLTVPGFHGLGILYPSDFEASFPALAGFVQNISATENITDILNSVERSRIENLISFEEYKGKLRELEKISHQASKEYEKQIQQLEKILGTTKDQLAAVEARAQQSLEKFRAELDSQRHKYSELEEKQRLEREKARNEIQAVQQKLKASEQAKNAFKAERDQLVQWIKKFRVQYNALLQSNRWKAGHALISFLTMSMFKKNFTMATHHMEKQFRIFEQFHFTGNALPERQSASAARTYPVRRHNLTVAVIAWDVGHNPLGRAYLLADALSRYFHVLLIGPSFPRYNHQVWEPLINGKIEVLPLPGKDFPDFLTLLEKVSSRIPADIIISCKARLPSIQAGLMMKAFKNRPLFVDVDDYELSFFRQKAPLSPAEIESQKFKDINVPFEETWTRFSENLLPCADGIFVSNPALQRKFGGVLVPHARDELRFDPSLYDKAICRAKLGIDAHHKVVLFLGTPREHKGVAEVLHAIAACNNPNYKLCVIGTPPDRSYATKLMRMGGDHLLLLPDQPFDNLPENLMVADLVCLIQHVESDISKYQLPAKAVDALAMGIPVLATRTEPLEPMIQAGAVEPVTMDELTGKIDRMLSDCDSYRKKQLANRDLFLNHYSYKAIGEKIYNEIFQVIQHPKKLPDNALDFMKIQKKTAVEGSAAAGSQADEGGGRDMVLFWKQNDTGIYGRRSDMFVKYLSRRSQVRKIAVFDMPISIEELRDKGKNSGIVHDRLVYRETMLREWGVQDTEKVSFHTFIYKNSREDEAEQVWRFSGKNEYVTFIENRLAALGIRPRHAIFWFYPQNSYITKLVKHFQPKVKIVDLVDDHRTWPDLPEVKRLYITNHYREVLKVADLAFANCKNVQQSLQKYFQDIQLIPNGCELDPPPDLSDNKLFQTFQSMKGPKLGYVGNLELAKIDMELIRYLAERRPDWQIILIGSTHANPGILELDRYANIHFFGVIQYPEVRTWIKAFDVAILPHLNTEKTRSMNPLKLYVYCSLGIPVVSTDIENLDELESFIAIANSYDDFIDKTEGAVKERSRSVSRQLACCLDNNSWDKRVDQILREIEKKWH